MIDVTRRVVPPPRRPTAAFLRWVAEGCGPDAIVLDIGAGANRSGLLTPVLGTTSRLVGVDPDEDVLANPSLSEAHRTTLEEFAGHHPEEFDAAFAVYVLEHVARPAEFVRACSTVLRPGASLFGLTLNVWHYFGASTCALARLGLSDRVLEALKGAAEAHDHHFPPEYRLNSIGALVRHLDAAGFSSVELRCFEATDRYQWYLPAGLRWFAPAYTRLAYRVGVPGAMGHLSFRAVK